uniref:NADH-ubiquinone oxidoreductase chain 4L n=1 Tax=Arbanatus sp. TaxID=2931282 RepID=A0A8T9ZY71_9HEMI|nr:NADH dehydrogenase subunit 4L [Arbanatus sp.]
MLSIFMLFSGFISFVSNKRHVLLALFSLEYVVLLNVYGFCNICTFSDSLGYLLLIYLVFAVSEGVLGLTVLAFMVRMHGNDYVSSLSPLW